METRKFHSVMHPLKISFQSSDLSADAEKRTRSEAEPLNAKTFGDLDSFNIQKQSLDPLKLMIQRYNNPQKSAEQVREMRLDSDQFFNEKTSVKDTIHIAGNSVYFDKSFIDKHMKLLSHRLNRRVVDVSTISILCNNLSNNIYNNKPRKINNHTALADIEESIRELKYYIKSGFILPTF